jgi:hypothetical protein
VAVAELDGRLEIVSGSTTTPWVWDLTNGRRLGSLRGHDSAVLAVAVGELDGRPVIVSGS